jgi:CTP-dependent riboflavin kinase
MIGHVMNGVGHGIYMIDLENYKEQWAAKNTLTWFYDPIKMTMIK